MKKEIYVIDDAAVMLDSVLQKLAQYRGILAERNQISNAIIVDNAIGIIKHKFRKDELIPEVDQ